MAGIGNSSTSGMGDIIQLNVGGMRYADVMTSLHKLGVQTVLFEMKCCAAAFDFDVMSATVNM